MQRKTVPIAGIKTADLPEGTFEGWASTFGNVDAHNDRVMPGAFQKSISSGRTIPLAWMHRTEDPTGFIGEVVDASETPEGLKIRGKFDIDTAQGAAAYRQVKSRRVDALSIGYRVNVATKADDGVTELRDLDLIEVSVVTRGANDRALIGAVKSAGGIPTGPLRSALARATASPLITTKTTPQKDTSTMHEPYRLTMLNTKRNEAASLAKSLLDTADGEGRDLTPDEAAQVDKATVTIKECDEGLVRYKSDQAIIAQANELAATIGPPIGSTTASPVRGGHLAITGKHAKALASKVIASMPRDPMGTKALAAGQTTTSTIVLPEVLAEGRPATSVLDVLPMRVVTPNYSFLRQNDRDFAAAPVAAGSEKPTSVVSVEAVENRLRVVAHISEQIDHFVLSDSVNLETFVADEMLFGLRRALEEQILVGDGLGENFTGITNTSGIQLQTFATNALTSVRKAVTKLDTANYSAGLVVLDAATWEGIELLTASSGATDARGVPVDPVARRLFGIPVVLSQLLGTGVGLVLGDGAVTVDHDNLIDTRWSDAVGDDFAYNFLRCRVEGRFGVSVNQPAAVVKVQTAASTGGASGSSGASGS